MPRLSSEHPREVVAVLRGMVLTDTEGWSLFGSVDEIRGALQAALAAEDADTPREAVRLVHLLGARGMTEFRDLATDAATGSSSQSRPPWRTGLARQTAMSGGTDQVATNGPTSSSDAGTTRREDCRPQTNRRQPRPDSRSLSTSSAGRPVWVQAAGRAPTALALHRDRPAFIRHEMH
jgi:hypothetical protein